jgi:hypothetical protein
MLYTRAAGYILVPENRSEQTIKANPQSIYTVPGGIGVDQQPGKDRLEKWNERKLKDLNSGRGAPALYTPSGSRQQQAARRPPVNNRSTNRWIGEQISPTVPVPDYKHGRKHRRHRHMSARAPVSAVKPLALRG